MDGTGNSESERNGECDSNRECDCDSQGASSFCENSIMTRCCRNESSLFLFLFFFLFVVSLSEQRFISTLASWSVFLGIWMGAFDASNFLSLPVCCRSAISIFSTKVCELIEDFGTMEMKLMDASLFSNIPSYSGLQYSFLLLIRDASLTFYNLTRMSNVPSTVHLREREGKLLALTRR
jgi:hypothetical protein